jgi:AcrR family transcriptional regulator
MSFRHLGRELGADPTAVYRHFRDPNELVEAALDRLLAEVVGAVPADLPWRKRLRAAASGYLEAMVTHPVIAAEAGHRTTGGPGELAMIELPLAAPVEAGLSREQTTILPTQQQNSQEQTRSPEVPSAPIGHQLKARHRLPRERRHVGPVPHLP